jgi:hypothetical protein
MEYIAVYMTAETYDGYELTEFIHFPEIEYIAAQIFNVSSVSLLDILLNSMLISQAKLSPLHYRISEDKITFVFRVLHEYFLSVILLETNSKLFVTQRQSGYFTQK